ncbi:MAG TPA: hypothetical protein VGR73_16235 [Bryobacteraceae bacterium]|nr:hypothetical protein [Bryobacteraceae bacterium]
MRTTLTLDPDVAQKLKARTAEEKTTFKQVVNQALRRGLNAPEKGARRPFRVAAHSMGVRPGVDVHKLNQLADEIETQDFVRKLSRPAERRAPQRRAP